MPYMPELDRRGKAKAKKNRMGAREDAPAPTVNTPASTSGNPSASSTRPTTGASMGNSGSDIVSSDGYKRIPRPPGSSFNPGPHWAARENGGVMQADPLISDTQMPTMGASMGSGMGSARMPRWAIAKGLTQDQYDAYRRANDPYGSIGGMNPGYGDDEVPIPDGSGMNPGNAGAPPVNPASSLDPAARDARIRSFLDNLNSRGILGQRFNGDLSAAFNFLRNNLGSSLGQRFGRWQSRQDPSKYGW